MQGGDPLWFKKEVANHLFEENKGKRYIIIIVRIHVAAFFIACSYCAAETNTSTSPPSL